MDRQNISFSVLPNSEIGWIKLWPWECIVTVVISVCCVHIVGHLLRVCPSLRRTPCSVAFLLHYPGRKCLWDIFLIWTEGLRTEDDVCCTDCEALWGKFVILNYINKTDMIRSDRWTDTRGRNVNLEWKLPRLGCREGLPRSVLYEFGHTALLCTWGLRQKCMTSWPFSVKMDPSYRVTVHASAYTVICSLVSMNKLNLKSKSHWISVS